MSDRKDRSDLGDLAVEEFRELGHRVVDLAADYLRDVEELPVVPRVEPGSLRASWPERPPARGEPFDEILADYKKQIEPNITHWQHPGFMAYFPSVAAASGILGEWLATALNSNVMFWKNAPASTELETLVVDWIRQMLGLPELYRGMFTDTASISSLLSLVAARHGILGSALEETDPRDLRLYVSTETHVSIEKAAIVAGIGTAGVRRIPADTEFRMRPDLLDEAIASDRSAGKKPFCVVATLGTTSSTSIDPAARIAEVAERHGIWMHVDAAYGGALGFVPEKRELLAGWEKADSIVFNPHKWMFTPFDASLLLFRDAAGFRDAFRLVPDYLRGSKIDGVPNFNEYGIQLGRRFRALKLWFMIRSLGTDGFTRRIRHHCELARELESAVRNEPDWRVVAPVPMATVCIRHEPPGKSPGEIDRINERILDEVNASGEIYLSGTRLDDRFVIRVALGHLRSRPVHVERCWSLLREAAVRIAPPSR